MNIQAKSSIVLILTLIIGVALGVLIDRTLIKQSFEKRIERFRSPGVFAHIFERIIQPDANQMEQIKKILDKHAEKINDYRHRSRQQMAALMDSLRAELEPILTVQQKEKLKESLDAMKKRPFGPRGRRPGRHFDKEFEPPPPDFEKERPFYP